MGLQFVEERAAAEAAEETHCQQAEQKRSTNHLTFPFSPAAEFSITGCEAGKFLLVVTHGSQLLVFPEAGGLVKLSSGLRELVAGGNGSMLPIGWLHRTASAEAAGFTIPLADLKVAFSRSPPVFCIDFSDCGD